MNPPASDGGKHICVYCSSSDAVDPRYRAVAAEAGRRIARAGHTLAYGGGNVGLMGAVARAAHEEGGTVFGVIPTALRAREGVAYELADTLLITETMQERKAILFTRADAFLVLPGGFGTLEELTEVLTLKQLHYHDKPIAIVNTDGFYEPLLALFEHFYQARFAKEAYRTLYHVAPDPADALAYFDTYRPGRAEDKW